MPELAVAVVKADHNIMTNLTMDPIDAFRLVANQAKGMLNYYQGASMVIAPEYFLNTRLATNAGVPEAMQRSEKRETYKTLEQISGGLGNTILIAGTIFYVKRWNRRALNVCPVLKNGKIIYKYYKKFDDGATAKNYQNATFEDKNTSPIFTSDGITFGVEVCGDMGDLAASKRNWQGQLNSGSVDVHVVIADGAGIDRARIQARAGGYIIYTDLAGGPVKVLHSASGAWKPQFQAQGGRAVDPADEVEPSAATISQTTGARILIYDLTV